jgi:ribosomal protein L28
MAKTCPVTDKSKNKAGQYSNRVRATQFNPTKKRDQNVNFQTKRIYVPELNETIKLEISTAGMKTIAKKGPYQALKEAGIIDK